MRVFWFTPETIIRRSAVTPYALSSATRYVHHTLEILTVFNFILRSMISSYFTPKIPNIFRTATQILTISSPHV